MPIKLLNSALVVSVCICAIARVLYSTAKIARIDCSCEHPKILPLSDFDTGILKYSTAKLLEYIAVINSALDFII